MDNSLQTSFIPKKPIKSGNFSKAPINLFSTLAISILVITFVLIIGFFFYKVYLTKQKETLSASLLKARDSFEKETINELDLFSKRVEVSKQILDKHIVLSPVFSVIGEITIPSVQYIKFEHQTTDRGFLVKMEGIALDYRSIALQSEMFNSTKGRFFKNVVFSNLVRNSSSLLAGGNNYIKFNVDFTIDPSLLSYSQNKFLGLPSNVNTTNPSLNFIPQNLENNF